MFTFSLDRSVSLLTCHVADRLDFLTVARTFQRMLEDTEAVRAERVCFVVKTPEAFVALNQLRILPLLRAWVKIQPRARYCVVVPDESSLAKAESRIALIVSRQGNVKVFLDEADAREWLFAAADSNQTDEAVRVAMLSA